MKFEIEISGKVYNDRYTFETPKEGSIADEVAAIIKEMEEGNISAFKIEAVNPKREARKALETFKGRSFVWSDVREALEAFGNVTVNASGYWIGRVQIVLDNEEIAVIEKDDNDIIVNIF